MRGVGAEGAPTPVAVGGVVDEGGTADPVPTDDDLGLGGEAAAICAGMVTSPISSPGFTPPAMPEKTIEQQDHLMPGEGPEVPSAAVPHLCARDLRGRAQRDELGLEGGHHGDARCAGARRCGCRLGDPRARGKGDKESERAGSEMAPEGRAHAREDIAPCPVLMAWGGR